MEMFRRHDEIVRLEAVQFPANLHRAKSSGANSRNTKGSRQIRGLPKCTEALDSAHREAEQISSRIVAAISATKVSTAAKHGPSATTDDAVRVPAARGKSFIFNALQGYYACGPTYAYGR